MPIRIVELSCQRRPACWGKQGENEATLLSINIASFIAAWPDGVPVVTIKRQDGHPYYKTDGLEVKNNILTFPLSTVDAEIAGRIECTVNWTVGDNVAKTQTYFGFITEDPGGCCVPPTSETIIMLDNLKQYVEDAEAAAELAQSLVGVSPEEAPYLTHVLTLDKLPVQGQTKRLYLVTSSNSLFYWDEDIASYVAIASGGGGGGGTIPPGTIIHGGNAYGY